MGKFKCWEVEEDHKIVIHLDGVVAGDDPSVLDFDVRRRVCELAVGVGAGALVALELPAHLKLEPPGVLDRRQAAHHGHGMTDGHEH